FIDLDGFKAVNDSFGHLVGDRVLCEIARRLVGCVRAGDMAARFGGYLQANGIGPGDVVMWQLPNWWESLAVAYGIWAAGAISAPVVPIYREHELRQVVEAARKDGAAILGIPLVWFLNSIGLQNPGVDAVIERYGPIWQGWKVPVIVNVAGESIQDYVEVARRLDGVPGVAGIELNISCPNVGKGGLQFAIDRDAARAVTAAVRRATELPLLVKLSPNVADVRPIAKAIEEAGADAISAINTLSGLAVAPDRTRAFLGNTYGGLSGPAVKPVALRIVYEVAQVVSIPIVAIGGVTNLDDVLDFLACGAVAVQVGTAIFADPELPVRLADELRAECLRRGLDSYRPLVGTALPKRAGAPSANGAEYRP
ncbi:MAG: dihydroorotate dehydrogenase, partial [Candidatus Limnocylindrales bacterium]